MTPVFQTKFPPAHKHGNCLAAVFASLLDLRIEDVPNFEVIQLCGPSLWENVLDEWLWQYGLKRVPLEGIGGLDPQYDDVFMIVFGEVAGQYHAAIYANKRLVHDPTPGGGGLDEHDVSYVLGKRTNGVYQWLGSHDIVYSPVPQVPDY